MKGDTMAKKVVSKEKPAGPGVQCLEDVIDQVQARAYELFRDREGRGQEGNEVRDWVQAEKEIRERFGLK
jgi:hypothetical protein